MTRKELLLKPNWSVSDITFYLSCGKTKAYEIMRVARNKYKGNVACDSRCVSRDSLLLAIGSNIEREVYILNQIKKGGANGKTL